MVFTRRGGGAFTEADKAAVVKAAAELGDKNYPKVSKIVSSPQLVSPNGQIMLAAISGAKGTSPYDPEVLKSIKRIRADVAPLAKAADLTVGVTGQAAIAVDTQESSGKTDAMIMMATLVLIVVLLLLIFRSPLIAVLPVIIISFVFGVATGLIAIASDLGGLKADASVSSILIVVLFGVGTDYILFLLFRYREHLRAGQPAKDALSNAVAKVGETIASAAGAVIAAFLALLLSTMGGLRSMGPSLAIAVAVALVAALTLVPAVFSLLGTKAFWPSKAWQRTPKNVLANAAANVVAHRPVLVAAVSAAILAVLAVGALGFKPEFDSTGSLPKDLESVRTMEELQKGFAAGSIDPTIVYVRSTNGERLASSALTDFSEKLGAVDGVGTVSPAQPNPDGSVARFAVALEYRPAAEQAVALVGGPLRDAAHRAAPAGSEALVGGTTSVLADIKSAVEHDYSVVFPVAAVAIVLILALLLMSLVAPLYLMLAVGLGFGATLGATVWLFQNVQGESGLLFTLPVVVYLFVVALGTDYNILILARLREEVRNGLPAREAARTAVAQSAPTIGAAAIILGGTFGVLMLAKNSMLQQMGFAVAFGILLTAFIMALLMVPAVTTLLGNAVWWPRHPNRAIAAPRSDDDPAPVSPAPSMPADDGLTRSARD
jgi:RND superfamily putative drug exporter